MATGACGFPAAGVTPDSAGDHGPPFVGLGMTTGVPNGVAPTGLTMGKLTMRFVSRIADLQRRMARCKRGSVRYHKLRARKAKLEAKTARRRREALHEWTTRIADQFGDLTVIKPDSIKEATASGKGDEREWGAAVKTKATMNRHVLAQAPALAVAMLEYKSAERGAELRVVADQEAPVEIGNLIVIATKETRKLKRTVKYESRPSRSDRNIEARA